ncbi:nucleoside phosphorylase domain-containing protein [Trichoderma sp. SZMC 28015]
MPEPEELTYDSYTVGWVCVLLSELSAARALLDEEHDPLPPKDNDDNSYLLGTMAKHNVVIVFPGEYGTNAAAQTVANTLRTFPNIRFGLMVGVGGGAPKPPHSDPRKDIRLGDVVVSCPMDGHGGVLQYDMGKWADEVKFTITSHLNKPPQVLLKAIKRLQLDHGFNKGKMWTDIDQVVNLDVPALEDSGYPGVKHDQLFKSDYRHSSGENCSSCDKAQIEARGVRKTTRSVVHYGLIASGNAVMRSSIRRDELRDAWGVACFEMEAAGLMDAFPCLVIRGICDYSDSHKHKIWQPYAAITAAAYAKDLLRIIHPKEVETTPAPKIPDPPKASQANGNIIGDASPPTGAQDLRADNERLRAETERLRAEAEKLRAEAEMLRAQAAKLQAENDKLRAETEKLRAENEKSSTGVKQPEPPRERTVTILPQGYFQNGGYYPGEEQYLVVSWQSGNKRDVWAIHDDNGPLGFIYPAPSNCQTTRSFAFSGRLFCPRAPHISFHIN